MSPAWVDRLGLPFDPGDGLRHQAHDVAALQVASGVLVGYHDAVHQQTTRYVQRLSDADPARIVDGHGIGSVAGRATGERDYRRSPARRPCGVRSRSHGAQTARVWPHTFIQPPTLAAAPSDCLSDGP
jgi:hypothetical protein